MSIDCYLLEFQRGRKRVKLLTLIAIVLLGTAYIELIGPQGVLALKDQTLNFIISTAKGFIE